MRALRVLVAVVCLVVGAAAGAVAVLVITTPDPSASPGWTRGADMPTPRGETAMAVLERLPDCPQFGCSPSEHLIVAGGIAGAGRSVATVNRYFPGPDVWLPGPDLPEPRNHAAAAAMGGTVFVTGGSAGVSGPAEPTLWVMRDDASGWNRLDRMPEARWGHAMVALDGRLYVVGGRGGTGAILVYDPARGWVRGAALPRPRDHLAAVVASGRIWAIGGRSGGVLSRRVDVYDPAVDGWTQGPPLPRAMSAMAAGVLGGEVHVVGGERPAFGGGVIDRQYALDLVTMRWREEARPVVAVHGVPGGAIGSTLVVAGGSRRQGALSVLGWTGVTQSFAVAAREGEEPERKTPAPALTPVPTAPP